MRWQGGRRGGGGIEDRRGMGGGAMLGRFGGTATFVKWKEYMRIAKNDKSRPNELYCGPEYTK